MWRYGIGLTGLAFGAWIFAACSDDSSPGPSTNNGDSGVDAADANQGDAEPGSVTAACQTYCAQVGDHCQGDVANADKNAPTAQYLSTDGCLHACAKMSLGNPTDEEGDSISCRIYHSGAPAQAEPGTHCPHSGIAGGGLCSGNVDAGASGRCATFCHLALAVCDPSALSAAGVPGLSIPFSNEGDCLSECGKTRTANEPVFTFDSRQNELTRTGDTLNCRQYHLAAAYNDKPPATGVSESAKKECPYLKANGGTFPPPDDAPCVGDK